MKLYHYRRLNDRLVNFLRDRQMYFQSPLLFNDPFDFDLECLQINDTGRLEGQLVAYKKYLQAQIKRTRMAMLRMTARVQDMAGDPRSERLPLPAPAIEIAYTEYGLFAQELANLEADSTDAAKKLNASWTRMRAKLADNLGVLCFSECPTQILMWSHYADSHKGVCLEFDSDEIPIRGWKKYAYHQVKYVDHRSIDVLKVGYTNALLQLLTCKSKDWAYERERRLISIKGKGFQSTRMPAITAITLGAKLNENDISLRRALLDAIQAHQQDRRSTTPMELRVAEKVSGNFRLAIRRLHNVDQLALWLGLKGL